jgi:hypothetical protein
LKRRALLLPVEARYDELVKLPQGTTFGTKVVEAMNAIERDFEPLRNQLPKEYEKFDNALLEDLLRVFDSDTPRAVRPAAESRASRPAVTGLLATDNISLPVASPVPSRGRDERFFNWNVSPVRRAVRRHRQKSTDR